jgi:tetratricopeptide (TPR) repeat protein
VARGGGAFAAALAPAHLVDVANVLVLLAPLVPLVLLAWTSRAPGRGLELAALLALALPLVALTLFVHPQQGLYRDWDVFAPAGMALALIAAWTVAGALARHASYAGLGIAVALMTAAPAVQWLALQSDVPRALARIERRLLRPATPAGERAAGWDFVGMRYVGLGRAADGEQALRRSVEAAPNPRILVEWGVAVLSRGDFARALPIFQRAAALDPLLIGAWRGLATAASAIGDRAELARAADGIERLNPGDPMVGEARAALGQAPPDSAH